MSRPSMATLKLFELGMGEGHTVWKFRVGEHEAVQGRDRKGGCPVFKRGRQEIAVLQHRP